MSKNQQAIQKLQGATVSPPGTSYEAKGESPISGRFDQDEPFSPKGNVLAGNLGISTKDTKIKDMSEFDEPSSPKRHVNRSGRLMAIVGKGSKDMSTGAAGVKEIEEHF